jgi:fatty acid-binding protein DegV
LLNFFKLAKETDEFLAIMLSKMFSGIYGAALQAKAMVTQNCRIEVIDSELGAGAQMLLAIFAAQIARTGGNLAQIVDRGKKQFPRSIYK